MSSFPPFSFIVFGKLILLCALAVAPCYVLIIHWSLQDVGQEFVPGYQKPLTPLQKQVHMAMGYLWRTLCITSDLMLDGLLMHQLSLLFQFEDSNIHLMDVQLVRLSSRVLGAIPKRQGCVVHRGIKPVGREPSWCRFNSKYHEALAAFFIPS